MTKILVIDDEVNIVELVKLYLSREGYQVDSASTAAEGLAKVTSFKPDLVVLDIMLTDMDGLEVCKRIRAESAMPILMLSARREDVDRIVGLELGADDYLTKPFNPHELTARVKAILRRVKGASSAEQKKIDIGKLHIDLDRHEVTVAGNPVSLRSKEFALLTVLVQNQGIVLSRERLLTQVWGYDYYGETRTVDVHVNHLRDKLAGSGVDIETLRGTGYKLVEGK
jgi:two-component system, OmpR family, alkaline phosphatase synthesis response regulator PhoP